MVKNKKIRPIAFYLPQFYPTPENDEWWEPGFTEWTNVKRAKPLFEGHNQPRVAGEFGYYDLRDREIREKQAELAREAGIEGFCYWHYWFGNGKRLLSEVFQEVVETGKPDYPFCLCWANHSWYAKTWDPNKPNKLLVEQTYPGEQDFKAHFKEMLPAFQDERYIKVDGKLLFGIFDARFFQDFKLFKDTWNNLAKEEGLVGFHFFCLIQEENRLRYIDTNLYDSVVFDTLQDIYNSYNRYPFGKLYHNIKVNYLKRPYTREYKEYVEKACKHFKKHPDFVPCIDPDFDHSPRSAYRWVIMKNSNPQLFGQLCSAVKKMLIERKDANGLLFIKAWNEWGEGNYMEPDAKWGRGYIEEMRKAMRDEV